MKDERWELVITIVDKALTLSGREQETYLRTAYRENPVISAEIEAWLRSIEEAEKTKFLESLDQGYNELLSDMDVEESSKKDNIGQPFIGKEFGAYRITECIGEGGMGTVYKAERTDGDFHHTVAIKLIKQGLDSKENIRRFKMEREVLAGLHHPNIAQLYDGGINPEGTPYLVMEFVDGIPIDQYCNKHRLTIDQRLALFKDACSAIQYAHNNLVIHRDLKNHNVFVSREGVVKILDFGVAKLLADPLDETTLVETQPDQRFWTPQYAAPEQVKGAAITTATDIYTLGALLYKLLTDAYPLDLEEKNLMEVGRTIQEEAALPPSRKIRQGDMKGAAFRRSASPSELVKTLSGDLDALTLKALRKEPEYRYHSVGQLLDDLDNYHKKLPLAARNGTIKYRIGKFFRRYKMGISAAAVFLVLAIGFTAFYSYRITAERNEAQRERDKSEQVIEYLMSLMEVAEPNQNQVAGNVRTVRDLLDLGVKRVESSFEDYPELRAQMLVRLGSVYHLLDEPDTALSIYEGGVALAKDHQDIDTQVNALRGMAQVYSRRGNVMNVLQTEQRAVRLLAENDLVPSLAHARTVYNLRGTLNSLGRKEEASDLVNRSLRLARADSRLPSLAMWFYLNAQAQQLMDAGQLDNADLLVRESLELGLPPNEAQQYSRLSRRILASLALRQGDTEGSLAECRSLLDEADGLYPKYHAERTWLLDRIAGNLIRLGRLGEAEKALRKGMEIQHGLNPSEKNLYYALDHGGLATLMTKQGRYAEAVRFAEKGRRLIAASYGRSNGHFSHLSIVLTDALRREGRLRRSEAILMEALEQIPTSSPIDRVRHRRLRRALGELRLVQNRPEAALNELNKAVHAGPDSLRKVYLQDALETRARVFDRLGRVDDAKADYVEAVALGDQLVSFVGIEWPRLLAGYAHFLADHNDPETPNAMEKALEASRTLYGKDHALTEDLVRLQQEVSVPR